MVMDVGKEGLRWLVEDDQGEGGMAEGEGERV